MISDEVHCLGVCIKHFPCLGNQRVGGFNFNHARENIKENN